MAGWNEIRYFVYNALDDASGKLLMQDDEVIMPVWVNKPASESIAKFDFEQNVQNAAKAILNGGKVRLEDLGCLIGHVAEMIAE